MTMRNCGKCLNNNWMFNEVEKIVTATCKVCGHEVQFASKKTKYKAGDQCKNCLAKLVQRGATPCYKIVYRCLGCKRTYTNIEDKVLDKKPIAKPTPPKLILL